MKIFTEKTKAKFIKSLDKFNEFCEKSIDEKNGTFEVVASTNDVDRHGEQIDQAGWDIKNYKKNPVILFAHNSWGLPIGKATEVSFEKGKMIIKGIFASADANPRAQQVRALYDEGILKTVSVGFIIKKRDDEDSSIIRKQELLELSFVPIPANPQALDRLKKAGISTIDLSLIASEKEADEEEKPEEKPEEEEEVEEEKPEEKEEESEEEETDEEEEDDEEDDEEEEEEEEKEEEKSITTKVELSEKAKKAFKKITDVLESVVKELEEDKDEGKVKEKKHPEGSKKYEIKMGAQRVNKLSQNIIEKLKK